MRSSATAPHSLSPYTQSLTGTHPENPFSARFNAALRELGIPVSTTDELRAMVKSFAKDEAHLQELTNKLVAAAEANLPESGRIPIFGATPEESGEEPFQILKLPDPFLHVRFFCGASPAGVLFFDFVDGRTRRPVDLPSGYSVWQRMPEGNIQLIPLHTVLGGAPPDGRNGRFALKEGTWVMLRMPGGQDYDFQSPVIPRP
ncbi:hypothetical protein B0H10DRAFT_2027968 [Mycena sp. CBHHK59/15]|nr:hypothetical protein B0H10DRAFT_2027968 [Mycena sp. CBHHK59/15]